MSSPRVGSPRVGISVSCPVTVAFRLLQLSSMQHLRHPTPAVTGHTECMVTGTEKCDHITSVLQQLHWLSVRQQLDFKVAVLVYNALNKLAPPYPSGDCQLVATTGRRQHRSSDNFKCTNTCISSRLGDRAFAAVGPRLWNSLPTQEHHTCPSI